MDTAVMEIDGATEPTVDDVPELKLRSYQQEMLEASLKRNIIVAVGYSGKSHMHQ